MSPVPRAKLLSRAILAGTSVYLAGQVVHTVLNTNRWPFCTFNMFAYHKRDQALQMRVRLFTDDGEAVGPTDPWSLLPLEFFRVVSVLERVFHAQDDVEVRDRFCRQALERLNRRGWRAWDEVKASFSAGPGRRFVAMELYFVEVDFRTCSPYDRTEVTSAELVHRYDPEGVVADRAEAPLWRFVEPLVEETEHESKEEAGHAA
ncbi:hypothetical protein HHL19_01235 [Streptomyces sp. R302]|uniref:hypothetical protein n=1 Tax=unclassified Streptomyces TaxID=2593676 RepID=UPI00145C41DE|nr:MULTISPECIES: hypothetical protein [unclassified Streptomyces]NML48990.1 hypothetical protein [Streptomyces sp. R301]NML77317.1 hypothetical protein [Streptomyces sp. R302]